jgi:hypothetical protein
MGAQGENRTDNTNKKPKPNGDGCVRKSAKGDLTTETCTPWVHGVEHSGSLKGHETLTGISDAPKLLEDVTPLPESKRESEEVILPLEDWAVEALVFECGFGSICKIAMDDDLMTRINESVHKAGNGVIAMRQNERCDENFLNRIDSPRFQILDEFDGRLFICTWSTAMHKNHVSSFPRAGASSNGAMWRRAVSRPLVAVGFDPDAGSFPLAQNFSMEKPMNCCIYEQLFITGKTNAIIRRATF